MTKQRKFEIDPKFASAIRKKYSPVSLDETEKIFDYIQAFFSYAQEPGRPLKSILDQAVRTIYRSFDFKEVSLAIKSEKDGLYRYVSLLGFRKEAEKAQWRLAYTYEEQMDTEKYPTIKLGRLSEFNIEDASILDEDEIQTFNRPLILKIERKSFEEPLETDYFTIYILGYKEELLGFIEVGKSRNGKLPQRSTIKWVELIGSTLGFIIQRERIRKDKKR